MRHKRLFAVIMAAVLAFSMVGCGNAGSNGTGNSADNGTTAVGGGATGSNTDGGATGNGTEGGSSTNAGPVLETNFQVSVKDLMEGVFYATVMLDKNSTIDDAASFMNFNFTGEKYDYSNMPQDGGVSFVAGPNNEVEFSMEYAMADASVSAYVAGNVFPYSADYGDSFTRASYSYDGKFIGIETIINDVARNNGSDYSYLDGFAPYMYNNQINSMNDFISVTGIDTVDSEIKGKVDKIMAGGFDSAKGEFTTEYGKASYFLTCFTVNTDYPTALLTINFEDDRAPFTNISVTETYYGSFFTSEKFHNVNISYSEGPMVAL